MKFGAIMFATDQSIQPTELARAIEERGLDGLFVPEHTHIPLTSRSPFFPDGKLPPPYLRTYDPFVVLGAAAAVTERIHLGTGICLVSQRHPISLAKEVATVDRLSNGRFIFGVGAGWNKPEIEHHGVVFEQRWKVVRERIQAMRAIWTEDEPEFHGEFVQFDKLWSYPKPVQAGGPPIWLGANSRFVAERVAEYADGWLPVGGREGGATIDQVREACVRRGRRFEDLTLADFYAPQDESQARAHIAQGYTYLVFGLPSDTRDVVLPALDQVAALVDRLRR
ncbi:MAG: LLM class F420-dependent oxidoreductase [Gammaproteobacteria bacterium]|nr:LLM class F420-dependent oxidoreductase [Gammaproteobacteria bacterium]